MASPHGNKPNDQRPDYPALSLVAGFLVSGISIDKLWVDHVGLGGNLTRDQLIASLLGTCPLSAHEHTMLALALNEHLLDQGDSTHPVPYREA